jgi:predicted aldo/keto reductase-like oxidoreductase
MLTRRRDPIAHPIIQEESFPMAPFTRRQFLTSFAGTSGAFFLPRFAREGDPLRQDTPPKTISRPLGRTGITLPVVSMGVMRSDNPGLVRAALKSGMVHLDTAHGYQKGKNEEMLGAVLKEYPRESFVIATKIPPADRDSYLQKLDLSLQRLQMSYVDILYLHGASSRNDVLNPEMLAVMKEIKAAGKARHVGLSTHKNEPEVIRAAIESGVYDVVLTSVNFRQDHYPDVKAAIAEAAAAGIGIVAMKTMAGAFFDKGRTEPINCKAALKWVLRDPNITTAIPGITSFDQLAENAGVNSDLTLSEEERTSLRLGELQGGLYCNGCERCVPTCARALPVPEYMRAYMYTHGYANGAMGRDLIAHLEMPADPCAGCDSCTARCVKGFTLRERIADVARLHAVPAELLSGAEFA